MVEFENLENYRKKKFSERILRGISGFKVKNLYLNSPANCLKFDSILIRKFGKFRIKKKIKNFRWLKLSIK